MILILQLIFIILQVINIIYLLKIRRITKNNKDLIIQLENLIDKKRITSVSVTDMIKNKEEN